jgi:NTP pyrophosphatase (non-canonical NTP hydrolase)
MTVAEMLASFHAALGDEPGRGNASLRLTLHEEEHEELLDELRVPHDTAPGYRVRRNEEVDRAKLARELADVVYVAYGTAHAFDIDLEAALAEVHRAAMSKLDPVCTRCGGSGRGATSATNDGSCSRCWGTGKGERVVRSDGKVMKPPGFVAPDMSAACGHRRGER